MPSFDAAYLVRKTLKQIRAVLDCAPHVVDGRKVFGCDLSGDLAEVVRCARDSGAVGALLRRQIEAHLLLVCEPDVWHAELLWAAPLDARGRWVVGTWWSDFVSGLCVGVDIDRGLLAPLDRTMA